MNKWIVYAYKIGQIFGCGALIFIAFWLLTNPWFEPRTWLRDLEIFISIYGAIFLGADVLDLNPKED